MFVEVDHFTDSDQNNPLRTVIRFSMTTIIQDSRCPSCEKYTMWFMTIALTSKLYGIQTNHLLLLKK